VITLLAALAPQLVVGPLLIGRLSDCLDSREFRRQIFQWRTASASTNVDDHESASRSSLRRFYSRRSFSIDAAEIESVGTGGVRGGHSQVVVSCEELALSGRETRQQ